MSFSLDFKNDNPLRLWYNSPASQIPLWNTPNDTWSYVIDHENDIWQQNTLPIGNGLIAANVYGETKNERLTFNELTLWEGGPSKHRPNYNGGNNINNGQNGALFRRIQRLFLDGNETEAVKLCEEQLLGDQEGIGQFIGFGEIDLNFELDEKKVQNYVRYLDLDKAIVNVQYDYEKVTLKREYFISHPDNVLVIHITSTGGTIPSFSIAFDTHAATSAKTVKAKSNVISLFGQLEDNQMIFNGKLAAYSKSGSIDCDERTITISNSNEAYLYVTAATDYEKVHPTYRTGESIESVDDRVLKVINRALSKGYESIKNDHIQDYSELFSRVTLNLGDFVPFKYPTNEQLDRYKGEKSDTSEERNFEVLLFQYGRYLTISSSREGGILPSNLQGIWNDKVKDVTWQSDYHLNINFEMNYWPTFVTNLHECGIPMVEYVESLKVPGRITSEIYCGVRSDPSNPANGFMAHTVSTPFGRTAPGWEFLWGWSPSSILWILQNVFDYYLFTGDERILRDKIYPMMKEEVKLFDQIMVFDKNQNRLISTPSQSPEQGPPTNGNAYEQQLIWQHYKNTIRAAKVLNIDLDSIDKWSDTMKKLDPVEIGASGQVKEWFKETGLGSIGEKNHRHVSHLLGLYPGDLISAETKEWKEAAIVSLNDRGDLSTGWGMAKRINMWARIGDGNRCFKILHLLLCNRIFHNLWDYHPPFQIDGNFGLTAGIAEMLLQSNLGYINILPALPDVWGSGRFEGLVARGNVVVGAEWSNKRAKKVTLRPKFSMNLIVECIGIDSAVISDKSGNSIDYIKIAENRVSFNGMSDEVYSISNFDSH